MSTATTLQNMGAPPPGLVETIADRVESVVRQRGPGHCIQVPHLPGTIAEQVARVLWERLGDDVVRLVRASPVEAWHASPTKVVELRNSIDAQGARLVVILEAGLLLAAEDSFGASTFEVVDVSDANVTLCAQLLERIASTTPAISARVRQVTDLAVPLGISPRSQVDYLQRILRDPSPETVGQALDALGLIPDRSLGEEDEERVKGRLTRNLRAMESLTEPEPPAERLRSIGEQLATSDGDLERRLADALRDGVLDRHEIASRLAERGVDFASLHPGGPVELRELGVLALAGDISADVEPTLKKAKARIGIRYRARPAPAEIDGLYELVLDLVRVGDSDDDLLDTGVFARKRRAQLPKTTSGQWTFRVDAADLEPGFYRFRLVARDTAGILVRTALSTTLRIQTDLPGPEPTVRSATSVAGARLVARAEAFDGPIGAEHIVLSKDARSGRMLARLGWENVADSFELRFSPVLSELERYTLEDPRSLGRYATSFGESTPEEAFAVPTGVPEDFLIARERAFDAVQHARLPVEGSDLPPLVALGDLEAIAPVIEAYANSWLEAISNAPDPEARTALLSVDQLVVRDPGHGELRLAGPTHPLRLLWRLRHSTAFAEALRRGGPTVPGLTAAIDGVLPQHVPMVVPGDHGLLRSVACFGIDWTVYLRPSASDVPATLSRLAHWLGFAAPGISVAAPHEITRRIVRYLSAHPWVETAVVNFIQPGGGEAVLQSLLELQDEPLGRTRRYVVRMFASELYHDELGRAIDDFMASPDEARRWRNDAADALLAASPDSLAPRFTYSKHRLEDLIKDPSSYPAHLTFLLDWFEPELEAVDRTADGRSLFGSGLIVEPVPVYRLEGQTPTWRTRVAASPTASDLFERVYAGAHGAAAVRLGGTAVQDVAVRLELDRVKQSVIDAVHRASDWVVTIDPVFGDEFLDAPAGEGATPRYVVESGDLLTARPERHVLVSTKSRSELRAVIGPALARHGLQIADDRLERLLDSLQAVGAGASLRLLADRNHADEALSLALGAVWLQNNGTLRRSLVIPLDLHQELFRAVAADSESGLSRSDLAVVRIEPSERRITFHIVELKVRSGGDLGIPADLALTMRKQLANSRKALREAMFDAEDRREPGSLAAVMRLRYVITTMRRYLDRALRYRLIEPGYADACRTFIDTADSSFTLGFAELGLVFDLERPGTDTFVDEGIEFTKIGRDSIEGLLLRPDERHATLPPSLSFSETVRTAAGGRPSPVPAGEAQAGRAETGDVRRAPDVPTVEPERQADQTGGPDPASVVVIGMAPSRRQFGVIGRVPGALPVALDMDGTNVVSVFGVQGSGKSYTLGTIIEAALIQDTPVNRLPSPLGAVVFHYSTDNSYVPEFAAMAHPNDDEAAVRDLLSTYGAVPTGVDDVRILVPPDLVSDRAADFPGLDVRPMLLGANELRLDDWKLLMGIEGGDQMYSKAMNGIFRRLRERISADALEAEIDVSDLSSGQKRIAQTRLRFARPYISETDTVGDHLVPGRLLIVDLRDELIESDEALSLFMILLGRFSQAEWKGGHFNKLIVFDEAHKYMDQPKLTNKIVETIREMRHRGTSVVIASQNPPSVPREVVELSSVIFVHRFTAPTWLDHIKRANADFGEAGLLPSQLTRLDSGAAFVWSTNSREFRRPQLVRVRPRLSKHGGGTVRATD